MIKKCVGCGKEFVGSGFTCKRCSAERKNAANKKALKAEDVFFENHKKQMKERNGIDIIKLNAYTSKKIVKTTCRHCGGVGESRPDREQTGKLYYICACKKTTRIG